MLRLSCVMSTSGIMRPPKLPGHRTECQWCVCRPRGQTLCPVTQGQYGISTGSSQEFYINGIKESCIQIPSESHAYLAWSSKNRSQTNHHPLRCAALLGKGHHVVAVEVQRLRSTKEHGFSCCPRSIENAEDLRGLECRLYWDRYANIIPKYPKCLEGDARVPTAFDSYACCGLTIRS